MVYVPGAVDVEDFNKIRSRVSAIASNINVYVQKDETPDSSLIDSLAQHPTLVFSPLQLKAFFVNRGRIYAGRPMQKSEQLLRLQLAGVPVPSWSSLDRAKRFDPDSWGEYVVVKPEINSGGRGVMIHKTCRLNEKSAMLKQFSRDGSNLIVQKLIYNHSYSKIRIQMLFDEVLYARRFCFQEDVKFNTEDDMRNYQRLFTTANTRAEDYASEEVFKLAKCCYQTFDDVAMLALDVMLDEGGNPHFIEANPGGNTWHFSSTLIGQKLRARGTFLEQQFGAFERAGDVLARKALEEAI